MFSNPIVGSKPFKVAAAAAASAVAVPLLIVGFSGGSSSSSAPEPSAMRAVVHPGQDTVADDPSQPGVTNSGGGRGSEGRDKAEEATEADSSRGGRGRGGSAQAPLRRVRTWFQCPGTGDRVYSLTDTHEAVTGEVPTWSEDEPTVWTGQGCASADPGALDGRTANAVFKGTFDGRLEAMNLYLYANSTKASAEMGDLAVDIDLEIDGVEYFPGRTKTVVPGRSSNAAQSLADYETSPSST